MNAHVRAHSRFLCLSLLLSVGACDQALSQLPGPDGLKSETPTMRGGGDDGDKGDEGGDGSEESGDAPTRPKIICCNCGGHTCTQPALDPG